MANSYTTQPLYFDTDMTVGFREESGLLSGQEGVFVCNMLIIPNGTVAAGTINIVDPVSSAVLFKYPVATTLTPVSISFYVPLQWRDFKITGLTATVTAIQIWTR